MQNQSSSISIDSFCDGMASVLGLESALSGAPVDSELVKRLAILKTGIFRIVVMGEIKKGKSSFINALLGYKDLVPVCSDIATSTLFKICYGPQIGYKVFFKKESGKNPVEIEATAISAFGTEDGNPGNEKQVEFIQVFCPSPLLREGLVLIDTPGLGGLFKHHKRITYEYVPKADAVFLVTDSVESPIGQAELDLLEDLKKVTKHIYFVQTKARLVDSDAREARKTNNLSILTSQAGFDIGKIHYFVVDSQTKFIADEEKDTKKLERSGFSEVSRFINGYIRPNVHRLLLAKAQVEFRPHVDHVARELETQESIVRTKTEEDRAELSRKIEKEQRALQDWEAAGKREIAYFLDEKLADIRQNAISSISKFRPNGELHQEICATFAQAETAEEIQLMLDSVQENLSGVLSQALYETKSELQTGCIQLLSELGNKIGRGLDNQRLDLEDDTFVNVSSVHNEINQSTTFEKCRNAAMGGMITSHVGALIGSFIPAVGPLVGAIIGGVIGGWLSGDAANTHELLAARNQANGAVAGWLSNCYSDMQQQITNALDQVRRNVNNIVSDAIAALQKEKTSSLQEIKRASLSSAKEFEEKQINLSKRRETFRIALTNIGVS